MLVKSFFSTILLLSLSCNVLAFDASAFKSLNRKSEDSAKVFLALPEVEATKIALEHIQLRGKRETNYTWQIFLLAFLSNQDLSPEQWRLIESKSLISELDDVWDYKNVRQIGEKLSKEDEETSLMCFALLKIVASAEKKDLTEIQKKQKSNQNSVFRTAKKACIHELIDIINREDVFNWYIDSLGKGIYSSQLLGLFKQNKLLSRVLFNEKQGASFSILSVEQQQRLIDAWIPYFVGKKSNSSFRPYNLSRTFKSNKDDEFKDKFMAAIEVELSANKPEKEKLTDVLESIVRIENDSSSEIFLNLAWKAPKYKDDIGVFADALEEGYSSDNRDKNFPSSLHAAASKLIIEDQDIRFADVYLKLLFDVEGGEWNEEHLDVINAISKIAPNLANDTETQGILKHTYLSAATIEYYVESKHLGKTKIWLDKAQLIKAPSISWYSKLSGVVDKSPDLHGDFKGIKTLHEKGQLTDLSNWIEHKKKPANPFVDLPLGLYELFTGNTTEARVRHSVKNGHAIILDDYGDLHYFDGYSVVPANQDEMKITRLVPGEGSGKELNSPSSDVPKITSSIDEWIVYVIGSMFGGDKEEVDLSSSGIINFANDNQTAQERLLFAELEDGELNSYPDYMEYSRHTNQVILSADISGDIKQYLFTLPNEGIAIQWMEDLKDKAPIQYQKADLWYKSTGSVSDDEHGIMLREYVSEDDDVNDKVVTALHSKNGFDYTKNGCIEFKSNDLDQFQKSINQEELALYKQGFVLKRIYHDEGCVEKSVSPEVQGSAEPTEEAEEN